MGMGNINPILNEAGSAMSKVISSKTSMFGMDNEGAEAAMILGKRGMIKGMSVRWCLRLIDA